ncbi:DUF4440 domain-containing protein [Microbulbifer sp. GL-2]|uniref:nuclear transport factor 2 family protein n=1 Tax=Microbulbifer sp. GL-2 TaxID=2591606 RepID=UPI0011625D7F|nr:DUF4440 domain-containing protein [Microbulbifer sp. GL-2]BBM00067.1 hypothetical protein GL2_01410 [Microbulbifer sp. GL-2]
MIKGLKAAPMPPIQKLLKLKLVRELESPIPYLRSKFFEGPRSQTCKVHEMVYPISIDLNLTGNPKMMPDMEQLIRYETALHCVEVRRNQVAVKKLLSPDFRETGKSGSSYDFNMIIAIMKSEENREWQIHSQDYQCTLLSESVRLLLYRTAHCDRQGNYSDFCKRASTWVLNNEQWQMKYHQGTPCEAFKIGENISAKQPAINL